MDRDFTSHAIWTAMGVDRESAADLLAVFARFEFAIKKCGFVRSNRSGGAEANWKQMEDTLTRECLPHHTSEVAAAAPYLSRHPARRQIVHDGALDFDPPGPAPETITQLLRSVKTTRNNLFHGGKFPSGPVAEPLRDRQLIKEATAVILASLKLDTPTCQRLSSAFWQFDSLE